MRCVARTRNSLQSRAKAARRPRHDRDAAVANRGRHAALRHAWTKRARISPTIAARSGRGRPRAQARPRRHGHIPARLLAGAEDDAKARYGAIMDDLQMIGYRNMLCGMHVHVAVPDVDTRINLIMRLTPYLPLLLALSTSSPFWQGHLTGLVGYRLAAYDELPRTGLPELFRTNEDYREFVAALTWRENHSGRELHLVGDAALPATIRPSSCASPTAARGSTMPSRIAALVPLSGARARPRSRAQCRIRSRRPRHHAREQMACPALRHRRDFVEPFSRSPLTLRAVARPGPRLYRRRYRSTRLRQARSGTSHAIVAQRHQRRPPDRNLQQGHDRRPAKVNGAQGRGRLGGNRNPGVCRRQNLDLMPIRASPYRRGHL